MRPGRHRRKDQARALRVDSEGESTSRWEGNREVHARDRQAQPPSLRHHHRGPEQREAHLAADPWLDPRGLGEVLGKYQIPASPADEMGFAVGTNHEQPGRHQTNILIDGDVEIDLRETKDVQLVTERFGLENYRGRVVGGRVLATEPGPVPGGCVRSHPLRASPDQGTRLIEARQRALPGIRIAGWPGRLSPPITLRSRPVVGRFRSDPRGQ